MQNYWEERGNLGVVPAFFKTFFDILGAPGRFFQAPWPKPGFWHPLLFGVICQTIGTFFQYLYSILFDSLSAMLFTFLGASSTEVFMQTGVSIIVAAIIIVFAPLGAVVNLFLFTFIYHVCLMIVGGNKKDLEATFRAICYSQGPSLFLVVPMIGAVIAFVWQLVLMIIGIKEIHGTTYPKAILAIIIPLMICCSLLVMGIAGIIFLIAYLQTSTSSPPLRI